mmetsp:Transcript_32958/g.64890  ORF Transcript_32958/g.64890 Transcript_32958/m.64890 type:complete len:96 (-) Transcript_32958:1968-2255(-)
MRDEALMELAVVSIFEQGCKAGLLILVSCTLFFEAPTLDPTLVFTSELTAKGLNKPGKLELRLVDGIVDECEGHRCPKAACSTAVWRRVACESAR